jgi:hypothetical protein
VSLAALEQEMAIASTESSTQAPPPTQADREALDIITPALQGDLAAKALPVERLNASERSLLEDFLRRRHTLAGRQRLAEQIAHLLHQKMEIPGEPHADQSTEAWLESVLYCCKN